MLWSLDPPHSHLSPCGVSPLRREGIKRRWCPEHRHKVCGKQDPQGEQSNCTYEGQQTGWDRSQPLARREGEREKWYQPSVHKGWIHKGKAKVANFCFLPSTIDLAAIRGKNRALTGQLSTHSQKQTTEEANIFTTQSSQVDFIYKNRIFLKNKSINIKSIFRVTAMWYIILKDQ